MRKNIIVALMASVIILFTSCGKGVSGEGTEGVDSITEQGQSDSGLSGTEEGPGTPSPSPSPSIAPETNLELLVLCPGVHGSRYEYLLRSGAKLWLVLYTYPDGKVPYLSRIYPGQHTTATDGRDCCYTINADLSVSY
jgi:hypothetical protein